MSLMKSLLTGACLSLLPLAALADPALIFDLGGKFDKSFNEAAYAGAERWKAETGGSYNVSNNPLRKHGGHAWLASSAQLPA